MYEQAGSGARLSTQVNVQIILAIHHVSKKVSRFVSDVLLYSDDERKLHGEIVGALLHAGLLSMSELSSHLAKHIDGGRNVPATAFAIRLVRTAIIDEHIASASDCTELLAALSKLVHSPSPPEGIHRLMEDASRALGGSGGVGGGGGGGGSGGGGGGSGSAAGGVSSISEIRMALASHAVPAEEEVDQNLVRAREQVMPLWSEWLSLYELPNQSDKQQSTFISALHTQGWLRNDAYGGRFLTVVVETALAAAGASSLESEGSKPAVSFAPLDALSTLVVLMIKCVPAEAAASPPAAGRPAEASKAALQLGLLSRALSTLMLHLFKMYDTRPQDFNQRAYLRVFGSWLFELNAPDPALDQIQPQVLSAFAAAFLALQPSRLPGFAFAWLELISHRMFMPKLLLAKGQRGWPHLQRLLVALFSFLQPYLSTTELTAPTRSLCNGQEESSTPPPPPTFCARTPASHPQNGLTHLT